MKIYNGCHHRFALQTVVHSRSDKPKIYKFRCHDCFQMHETTLRKIWHPTKMVPLTVENAAQWSEISMYSTEELLKILDEQLKLGRDMVFLNLERQKDGSWLNKALDDSPPF